MEQEEKHYSCDSFQRGRFWLTQLLGRGHRCGTDALLLASCVPSNFSGKLADFGAGAGAAGFSVAARCENAEVVLVEHMPEMIACAKRTLQDPRNSSFSQRVFFLQANLMALAKERKKNGLQDNMFDCVIMNPPFNPSGGTKSLDELKHTAYCASSCLPEGWVRTAAAVLKPKGTLALILRPEIVFPFLQAMNRRFGQARIVPIYSRKDSPAIRVLIHAIHSVKTKASFLPPLFLYEGDSGDFGKHAHDFLQGNATLFDS